MIPSMNHGWASRSVENGYPAAPHAACVRVCERLTIHTNTLLDEHRRLPRITAIMSVGAPSFQVWHKSLSALYRTGLQRKQSFYNSQPWFCLLLQTPPIYIMHNLTRMHNRGKFAGAFQLVVYFATARAQNALIQTESPKY